jgi:uncharacterized integral membrane protein
VSFDSDQSAAPAKEGPSRKLIIGGILAVLGLIFVFQNTTRGQVNFLFWDVSAPAWVWLVLLFVLGVVVGSLFPWGRRKQRD